MRWRYRGAHAALAADNLASHGYSDQGRIGRSCQTRPVAVVSPQREGNPKCGEDATRKVVKSSLVILSEAKDLWTRLQHQGRRQVHRSFASIRMTTRSRDYDAAEFRLVQNHGFPRAHFSKSPVERSNPNSLRCNSRVTSCKVRKRSLACERASSRSCRLAVPASMRV